MVRMRFMMMLLAVGFAAGIAATACAGEGKSVPRMTSHDLKGMLGSPDLVLLDVRQDRDWEGSGFKIKGAERKDPRNFDAWKDQLPKGKTLVLYCA